MPNNLYNQLNKMQLPNGISMEDLRNPKQAVLKRFGNITNPQQAVQQMLNNGQISQGQLNQVMQMAKQFRGMLK